MKWVALFYMFVIAIIVLAADSGTIPLWVRELYRFPGGDKVGHCVLMGLLGGAVNHALSYRMTRLLSRSFFVATPLVCAAVTLEELSQGLFPARTCSLADLAGSFLGIILADRLVWFLKCSEA
ncbi:MAG: hypothetical protein AB1724_09865 [Thermodesulfobacteriota bacterium]